MTAIAQALAQGYGGEEILKYLKRAFPKMAPSIAKATANGYGADQILKYVSRLLEDEKPAKGGSPHEIERENQERTNKLGKQIITSAATGLGLSAFAKNVPNIIRGAQQAIGAAPLTLPGTSAASHIGPKPMGGAPITPPPVNASSPIAPGSPIQPQAAQPVQPSPTPQQNAPPVDSAQVIQDMGIGAQVRNLAQAGNDPEAIATAVSVSLKPHQKKWLEQQLKEGNAKPLPEMIADFLSNPSNQEKKSPENAENVQKQAQNAPNEGEDLSKMSHVDIQRKFKVGYGEAVRMKKAAMGGKEENKPIEKGSIVATPDGEVVDIKDIRKTEALADEDGKLHKLKIGDLKLPDEKIQQTVARLLEIPEVEKSSIINYWSYDPEDKELFLMFHNGETYKYLEVPEELEEELLESSTAPKTKGQNEFGAWSQEDPQSRGATFINKLIANPKYKKTGKGEKPNPYYRKLRKGYDYWSKLRK
jgi:hypothetical protein